MESISARTVSWKYRLRSFIADVVAVPRRVTRAGSQHPYCTDRVVVSVTRSCGLAVAGSWPTGFPFPKEPPCAGAAAPCDCDTVAPACMTELMGYGFAFAETHAGFIATLGAC